MIWPFGRITTRWMNPNCSIDETICAICAWLWRRALRASAVSPPIGLVSSVTFTSGIDRLHGYGTRSRLLPGEDHARGVAGRCAPIALEADAAAACAAHEGVADDVATRARKLLDDVAAAPGRLPVVRRLTFHRRRPRCGPRSRPRSAPTARRCCR